MGFDFGHCLHRSQHRWRPRFCHRYAYGTNSLCQLWKASYFGSLVVRHSGSILQYVALNSLIVAVITMPLTNWLSFSAAGSATAVAASRVIFAFARDNALPFSKYWKTVNPYTHTPINAVWILVSCSAVLGCLGFINLSALDAVFNVASIGLYISYTIPIFCRITIGRKHFVPGPFSLGKWAIPIGTVACLWVAFISVIFLL
jgi:amino acid transporter